MPVTPLPKSSLLTDLYSLRQDIHVMRDEANARVEALRAQARTAVQAAHVANGRASVYRRLFHEDVDSKTLEMVLPLLDRIHSLEQELARIHREQAENQKKTAEVRAMFDHVCGRRVTLQALMEMVEERAKVNSDKRDVSSPTSPTKPTKGL